MFCYCEGREREIGGGGGGDGGGGWGLARKSPSPLRRDTAAFVGEERKAPRDCGSEGRRQGEKGKGGEVWREGDIPDDEPTTLLKDTGATTLQSKVANPFSLCIRSDGVSRAVQSLGRLTNCPRATIIVIPIRAMWTR